MPAAFHDKVSPAASGRDAGNSKVIGGQIALEQIDMLFGMYSTGLVGASLAAVVLVGVMLRNDAIDPRTGSLWAIFIVGFMALHFAFGVCYRNASTELQRRSFWSRLFTLCCFVEGLGWGWSTIGLVSDGHYDHQLVVLLVALGVAGGAGAAFGAYLPAFFALFVPTTLPYTLSCLSAADPLKRSSWPLMIVYMFSVVGLGFASNRASRQTIRLRLLSDEIAADLRRQKEIAEEANRAKSTFLAAASHDLRQPVHALGLFAGALRQLELPPEAQHLVCRVEGSVEALNGLFGALLDISRLDAGIVEVHRRLFPIALLVERVCLEFVEEGRAKGLSLSFRSCAVLVDSDPLLIERILRNLIANAVRYTTAGRVFVGCRCRAGALLIEVRDSGPGIAVAEQSRIFQEYYQIGNIERDRAHGLGLGLAIVRRLADLLEISVVLRSRSGCGSCFAVSLPLASAGAVVEASFAPHALAEEHGLVVVVDDEADIRDAMHRLLTRWGFDVIAASSGDEALALLAVCSERPRLLICDYRLRQGETGIETIARIRARYDEPVPAMLITGDTAPLRLIEAHASELALLHKPVTNAKLRAAVASLLADDDHKGES